MRKIVLAISFLLCVLGGLGSRLLVPLGSVQAKPSCDGTEYIYGQCEFGQVPPGYFQSQKCQAPMTGSVSCMKAIAFNIDYFYCNVNQKLDTGTNPPSYTRYCYDSTTEVECTHSRICSGIVYNQYNSNGMVIGQYTVCSEIPNQPTVTKKYQKAMHSASGGGCTATVPHP